MKLTGSSAIVTGGASGLGAATAVALSATGVTVLVADLPQGIEELTARGDALPGVEYVGVDVTDEEQVRAAVSAAAASAPLRTVVNCAGIAPSMRILGKRGSHDIALYRKVIEVNLVGSFITMAAAAEVMAQNEPDDGGQRGVVINTASVAAYEGQVGQAAYSSSKAGIAGLTIPAARDLAQYGIRVNTIAPGLVETPMLATISDEFRAGLASGVPFPQRLARPDEYAQVAMFLLAHDYINGETVRMDGALRMAAR